MMEPLRILVQRAPSGLLIASSPDLPGLHAMERTAEELSASLKELIPVLFAEKGEIVSVVGFTPVGEAQPSDSSPWIVADVRASAPERLRN